METLPKPFLSLPQAPGVCGASSRASRQLFLATSPADSEGLSVSPNKRWSRTLHTASVALGRPRRVQSTAPRLILWRINQTWTRARRMFSAIRVPASTVVARIFHGQLGRGRGANMLHVLKAYITEQWICNGLPLCRTTTHSS